MFKYGKIGFDQIEVILYIDTQVTIIINVQKMIVTNAGQVRLISSKSTLKSIFKTKRVSAFTIKRCVTNVKLL